MSIQPNTMHQTGLVARRAVSLVCLLLAVSSLAAEEGSAQGRFVYQLTMDADTYSMDLEVVDGIVVPDELIGGERVKVLLVGAPLDRDAFLAEFADSGHVMFAAMRLKIEERVEVDVCRYEDGSETEICGLHIHGPGLSKSSSGFGTYGDITESVSFEDGRVKAALKTPEPEVDDNLTYEFELSFDLPVEETAEE